MMIDAAVVPHLRRAWPALALTACVTVLASAAAIVGALQLAHAVTHVITGAAGVPVRPLWIAVIALAARGLLLLARDVLALRTGAGVVRGLRRDVLAQLFRLGPAHPWKGGRAIVRLGVVDGGEHLRGYLGLYLPQAIAAIVVPAALIVVLARHSLAVAIVVALGVGVVPVAQRLTNRLLGKRAHEHWDAYERYAARVGDSIAGLPTLSGLGAAERRADALVSDAEELRSATTASMNVSLSTYVAISAAMLLGTAGATLVAAWQAARGELEPAVVVMVLFLAAECFRPSQDLQTFWHEGFYGLAAARRLGEILDEEPLVPERPGAEEIALTGPIGLRLRGVSFRYPGTVHAALTDIDLELPPGRTTALVGSSGAGKTTLSRLLLRDLDPSTGTVALLLADGTEIDLRDLPLAQVRRELARVDQDVVLLDGTVREAVEQGAGAASGPAIDTALQVAQVSAMAEELPRGLDSPVGEGGRLLSGGQRQRVALARALAQGSEVLVLDEATSALDGENEALITEAMTTLAPRCTLAVIAHRLSTVARADHMVVLDGGRIVEQGAPEELVRQGGAWADMVAAQVQVLARVGAL